jgi:hypothetical protein
MLVSANAVDAAFTARLPKIEVPTNRRDYEANGRFAC